MMTFDLRRREHIPFYPSSIGSFSCQTFKCLTHLNYYTINQLDISDELLNAWSLHGTKVRSFSLCCPNDQMLLRSLQIPRIQHAYFIRDRPVVGSGRLPGNSNVVKGCVLPLRSNAVIDYAFLKADARPIF